MAHLRHEGENRTILRQPNHQGTSPLHHSHPLLQSPLTNPRKTSQAKDRSPDSSAPENDPLEMTVRSHSNFLENVPLAFIFLTVCELNGGNRKALSYVMALLFGLRVMHADVGLMLKGEFGSNGVGRPIGFLGSHAVLGGLAGYAGWLVKGYWGL